MPPNEWRRWPEAAGIDRDNYDSTGTSTRQDQKPTKIEGDA